MDAQRGIARRMVLGLPREGLTPAWEKDFAGYPPAGVIVFRRDAQNPEEMRHLTARLRELARPRRIFIGIDEEGGWVSQLAGWFDVPPNALLLGRGGTESDVEWAARVTGERLRALGIDWVFAPVADVHSEPRNPVIGPRAFGTDAASVSRLVAAAVRGYRAAGLACCLKHFPGHGATREDSHHVLPHDPHTVRQLEAGALPPFTENFAAGAVMTTHVVFPAIDPEHPATYSPAIVTELLRERLGFSGVCITDGLEMKGAAEGRSPSEIGEAAFAAGCDLLLFAFWDEALRRARLQIAKALTDGAIDHARFDASRPRLAAFDREHPEPTAEELVRPLDSLTPTDWLDRLRRIVENGLEVEGASTLAGPVHVETPAFPDGPVLEALLRELGVPLSPAAEAGTSLIAIANRIPPDAERTEELRAACRTRPTILAGLQNDSFLDDVPEAALRISAADCTPLTRRVVAEAIAKRISR